MMRSPYAEVVETHGAVVFFLGDRVYKFKKPVDLGFLDFRSLEARKHACVRELDLNRRFSQDVYLGIGSLQPPNGERAEPALVMRRMPADRRLSSLVDNGTDVSDELRDVARLLAKAHASAPRSEHILRAASADAVAHQWSIHLDEFRALPQTVVPLDMIDETERLAVRYCKGRRRLFDDRIKRGWVCDGHGDLLADDIFCLDDGPRILDCLDFDDHLRWGDVLEDISFLVMDLERLGRPDLGSSLLASYDEFSDESHPRSLVDHYVAYRASVRSKVAAIRYLQNGDEATGIEAHRLAVLARLHLVAAQARLVLVGGLPGTGKTTVSEALGRERDWTVISSDVVRKELAGIAADVSAEAEWKEGIYAPATTSLVYCTMLERAAQALRFGESVVLDASWTDPEVRELASQTASNSSADLVQLMCVTEPSVARERIGARVLGGVNGSDATAQMAMRMAEEYSSWPEAHVVDTTYALAETMAHVRAIVEGDGLSASFVSG
jgi:aminoglycoside phosphotransferase family enzyme/predicted kinase